MLADGVPFADEDEGEAFEFDDSGDDVPEANCLPPAPPPPLAPSNKEQSQENIVTSYPEGHLPSPDLHAPSSTPDTAPSSSSNTLDTTGKSSPAVGRTAEGEGTSAAERTDNIETDLPLPPPPPLNDDEETDPGRTGLHPKSANILQQP